MHLVDWLIVVAYLGLALGVGVALRKRAGVDKVSFFLAGRSLPGWWAGLSIVATTFAADTPLAVTGMVANRGLSGNWMWLSWMGVHAALVVYFATRWRRSEVLTDAELITLRYSGGMAQGLRFLRAGLSALVVNCIVLGWVLRAMVKIATPFFPWREWFPGVMAVLDRVWPRDTALGTPEQGLTILLLLLLVGTYSTLGGMRGVVLTDLVQFAVALAGSTALAFFAWRAVGGRSGLQAGLAELYGPEHTYLHLFPTSDGWISSLGLAPGIFGLYLFVQAFASPSADGGGYTMQRINSTRNPQQARRAALLFLVMNYLARSWPWFVVALVALVLFPLADAASSSSLISVVDVSPGLAAQVEADREMAYPVLMRVLLPPAALGLLVTSLLAAFMSTVDTHLNWGASYLVNDFYLFFRPRATPRAQVRAGRLSVAGFTLLAVLVSFEIDTIEQAWRWVSAIGAALGVPTVLRWLWWRVTALSELTAMTAGLATALVLELGSDWVYERSLIGIAAASTVGLVVGIALGRPTDARVLIRFQERVGPHGFWPGRSRRRALAELTGDLARWAAVIGGTVALLAACHQLLLFGRLPSSLVLTVVGVLALAWGARAEHSNHAVADPDG